MQNSSWSRNSSKFAFIYYIGFSTFAYWILLESVVTLLIIERNSKDLSVKTGNARFIEDSEVSGTKDSRNIIVKEVQVEIPYPCLFYPINSWAK